MTEELAVQLAAAPDRAPRCARIAAGEPQGRWPDKGKVSKLFALAAMAAVLCVVGKSAHAALVLELDPDGGPPGTVVEGRTIGEGALQLVGSRPVPLMLVPSDRWKEGETLEDAVPIGMLRVDSRNNGHVTFRVPDLPIGEYSVITRCDACAAYSGFRTTFPIGTFHVRTRVGQALAVASRPFLNPLWLLVAVALMGGILLAALVALRHRRERAVIEAR